MTTLPTELVKRLRGRSPNNYRTRSRSHRLDDKAAAALIETQATQLSSLRAKLAEAMEALEPLSHALADQGNPDDLDKPDSLLLHNAVSITFGECRRARRLIEGNGK